MEAELTEASEIISKTDNSGVTEEVNVYEAITAESKATNKMEMCLRNNSRHKYIKNNGH